MTVSSPFPPHAWPLVWQWIQGFRDRVADDFGPQTIDEFVAAMLARVVPEESFAVYRDGELGGLIWLQRLSPVLAHSHMVFRRSFWGREITHTTVYQVFAQAFDAGIQKIESEAFQDNHAIRSLARRHRRHEKKDGAAPTRFGAAKPWISSSTEF